MTINYDTIEEKFHDFQIQNYVLHKILKSDKFVQLYLELCAIQNASFDANMERSHSIYWHHDGMMASKMQILLYLVSLR